MPYKNPEDKRAWEKHHRCLTPQELKLREQKRAWQKRNAHNYMNVSIRLHRHEMYEPLKRAAEKRNISINALINLYCTWQLEQDDT
jgi:hypothetical protein